SMSRRAVRVAPVVRVLIALVFAAAALGAPRASLAHATSTSYLHIEAPRDNGPVDLLWDLAAQDIMWTIFIDQDFDGVLTWKEVDAARSRYLEPGVLAEISVARGGVACRMRFKDVALVDRIDQHFLSFGLGADCPQPGPLTIGGSLFMSGDA